MEGCELDSSPLRQGSVVGFLEHGNEISDSIKYWEYFKQMSIW
jgi:hypothetical protein